MPFFKAMASFPGFV